MNMNFFKTKNPDAAKGTDVLSDGSRPVLDGRDRLRHFTGELIKAQNAVTELEARLDRLNAIVGDADAANVALQKAIADDGGVALAEYAAGNAPDGAMAKLVTAKETTALAASAAKDARPSVEGLLERARSEIVRLEQRRHEEVLAYLKMRADDVALSYKRTFDALCRVHDQLSGVSIALAPTNAAESTIRMTEVPLEVPRFDLPSCTTDANGEYIATMRHVASEYTVNRSLRDWTQARDRLAEDVEANLDDLIGPRVANQ